MGGFVGDAFDAIGDFAGGLGKSVQGAFNGDFGSILNMASIIPSPLQPFALAGNALYKTANDDPLGGALSALGAGSAGGLFSNAPIGSISQTAGANTGNALSSFDGLSSMAPGTSSAINGATGLSSTLGATSSAMSPAASTVFNGVDGLSGAWGGINQGGGIGAGAGLGSAGSNFADLGGLTGNFSPMQAAGQVGQAGAQGGDMNFLQQLFGNPGDFNSMYNSPGANILGAGSRMLGGYMDYQNQRSMQDAYRNNIQSLQQLYSPDSPYATQMRNTLARRDAARGRNSQYGAREQALAANLTQNQAGVLGSAGYGQQLGASAANLSPWASILGNTPRLLSGLGSLF